MRETVGVVALVAALSVPGVAEATRLRVALVLDGSQSMRAQDPAFLARVAAKLLVDLAGPDDQITVVEFGTTGAVRGTGRGSEKDALFSAIDAVTRDQWCTDWAAGLDAALASFSGPRPTGEKRLLVLLTDGLYDPNRADPRYFTTDEARTALERITTRDRAFADHPCARSSAALAALAEAPFLERIRALATGPLRERGVQVFPIGFGSEIGGTTPAADKSRALLREIAERTGGTALIARSSQDLPGFFAAVFAALVGAPVDPPREMTAETTTFDVHPGARGVVVVVPTADAGLRVEATGARVVRSRDDYHEAGSPPEGYRLLDLGRAPPGRVTLRRSGGAAGGPVPRAWVIQDLGLRLGLDAPAAAVPQGTPMRVGAALVTSAGTEVPLSPEFLRDVTIEIECDGVWVPFPLVGGEHARRDCGVPAPGRHHCGARARHAGGLLTVEDVSRDIEVVRQIEVALGGPPLAFRTKAVPDFSTRTTVGVLRGTLPLPQRFRVDWSGVSSVSDLEVGPTDVTLAPGQSFELTARLRDHEALRSEARRWQGAVKIAAMEPRFYRGGAEWTVAVDGTLDPWTLADWWALYRTRILIGLGVFFLLFWIVGRIAAAAFGARVRLYYHRPDEPESAASSVRLAQSKSYLPFRSARHSIGRGGKPRAAKRHCVLVATRAGFRVVPADSAVLEKGDDGTEQERRRAFPGRHDVRYRTGDFVFWVSRSGDPPA